MIKVFSDFHHSGLLTSLRLLFEKRLGGELYRPIGIDWFENGFWKINNIPETAMQFLKENHTPSDGTDPLNDEMYHTISLEQFKKEKFDILIASIPSHIEPFSRLISYYQPDAKLIYQIGNQWNITPQEATFLDGVLSSAKLNTHTVIGRNGRPLSCVSYHQEFDLNIFHYGEPNYSKNIFSFVNCFNTDDLFKNDWELFQNMEMLMPDFSYKAFGGQCRDGWCSGERLIAEKMRESQFVWHTKKGGDGYGHVIHNAFAVGRPPIVKKSYYQDKMANNLMVDEQTCLVVDGLKPSEIKNKIEYFSEKGRYDSLSKNAFNKFKEVVNFDEEEKTIRMFLEGIK